MTIMITIRVMRLLLLKRLRPPMGIKPSKIKMRRISRMVSKDRLLQLNAASKPSLRGLHD